LRQYRRKCKTHPLPWKADRSTCPPALDGAIEIHPIRKWITAQLRPIPCTGHGVASSHAPSAAPDICRGPRLFFSTYEWYLAIDHVQLLILFFAGDQAVHL